MLTQAARTAVLRIGKRCSAALRMGLDVVQRFKASIGDRHLHALARGRAVLDRIARIARGEIIDLPEAAAFQLVHSPGRACAAQILEVGGIDIAAAATVMAKVRIPLIYAGGVTGRIGVGIVLVMIGGVVQTGIIAVFVTPFVL